MNGPAPPSSVNLSCLEDNVLELLALADRFLVDSLIEQCLLYVRFCERIPLIDRLLLAEKHKAKAGLMVSFLNFVRNKIKIVKFKDFTM
jgi:hypothetical protein